MNKDTLSVEAKLKEFEDEFVVDKKLRAVEPNQLKGWIHEALVQARQETIQAMEEIIGENEAVGLPVTQAQEQDNYNKKQRNKFRAELRKKLSSLKEIKE